MWLEGLTKTGNLIFICPDVKRKTKKDKRKIDINETCITFLIDNHKIKRSILFF